ncbi:MAG: hypothetical protein WCA38_18970, partial [Candidatus Acidiferrales bacterium]
TEGPMSKPFENLAGIGARGPRVRPCAVGLRGERNSIPCPVVQDSKMKNVNHWRQRHRHTTPYVIPGYDFTRNPAGFASDVADLNQSTAAILEQSTAAIQKQKFAAVIRVLNPSPFEMA